MKLSAGRLGFVLVAVVVSTALLVIYWDKGNRKASPGQPVIPRQIATTPAASEGRSSAKSKREAKKSGKRQKDNKEAAVLQAAAFLQSYYLIRPDDTTASRRHRIAPFVPVRLLPYLNVGLGEGTSADLSRIKRRLTQSGRVAPGQIVAVPVKGQPNVFALNALVVVTITRPNGKVINRIRLRTDSQWSYLKGRWKLTDFRQGGDTG